MKFPRSARILRSQFDVAPFAAVFFVLVIFMLLAALLPVPGYHLSLQPPTANDLPGVEPPTIAMAIDNQGRLYFENQIVNESTLSNRLVKVAGHAPKPLTLIIHADKSVSYELLAHLARLAGQTNIGITNFLLATLPGPASTPAKP